MPRDVRSSDAQKQKPPRSLRERTCGVSGGRANAGRELDRDLVERDGPNPFHQIVAVRHSDRRAGGVELDDGEVRDGRGFIGDDLSNRLERSLGRSIRIEDVPTDQAEDSEGHRLVTHHYRLV